MKIQSLLLAFVFSIILISCQQENHFITNKSYRNDVQKQFDNRLPIFKKREDELLSVFENLSTEEKEAMQFLYANMPLNDLADYDGEYFLKNVRLAFEIRESFPWGKNISEINFRHFVLPLRNNNENLDNHREVFFHELRDRVTGMNMEEAAQAVNHWCHEKVTYHGTDGRTISPLNAVKTAYGRCGEESVFAVDAFRSVGIPARQVYTPRWAHSDDNHAWVEVCIDGNWVFTGACEPAPAMNMGWFVGPASRGMLMQSRTFGIFSAEEENVDIKGLSVQLNVTDNYAITTTSTVKVVDTNGKAIEDATVDFCLYNYAELYPIQSKQTNKAGECRVKTGLGDILIWVKKDNEYVFQKESLTGNSTIEIVFDPQAQQANVVDFDLVPPIENIQNTPKVTDEQNATNSKLLQVEDRMRGAYEQTFIEEKEAKLFAKAEGYNEDDAWKILHGARGNHEEIKNFMLNAPKDKRHLVIPMLNAISGKDLHDTPASILAHHLNEVKVSTEYDLDFFANYILNPRVENELLTTYRTVLRKTLQVNSPEELLNWTKEHISITDSENHYRVPLSPEGTLTMQLADERSRKIFFVTAARSLGFPARLEPATRTPQYFDNGKWVDVLFAPKAIAPKRGTIEMTNGSKDLGIEPKYYQHFTIGQLKEGSYKTLNFNAGKVSKDFPEGITLKNKSVSFDIPEGQYMLTSGNRMKDGSVLTRVKFFTIHPGKKTKVVVDLRKDEKPLQVLGKASLDLAIAKYDENSSFIIDNFKGENGIVLAWLDPDREPTKHFMGDIKTLKKKFEQWGGEMAFMIPKDKMTNSFKSNPFDLPAQGVYGLDDEMLNRIEAGLKEKSSGRLPAVFIVNKNGEILYQSHGYQIGIGEQVLKTLNKITK